jgi:uncharacterized protein with von Willebrand factor type A (vWA) domain
MIDRNHELPVKRQAELVGISRGSVYYKPEPVSEAELALMRRIDELHLEHPFAGSRMLRDLHALTRSRPHVHSFTFGTRLTDVTRKLRHRDVDAALAAVGRAVPDWEGGTRIGPALREFNLRWSRRLLSQGAVVLLLTDGLDRADTAELATEAARLRRSCRRLVWLNPLLRFDGFEPRAAGVRALLPNVDEHRPVHSLDSLAALAEALSAPCRRGRTAPAARPRAP